MLLNWVMLMSKEEIIKILNDNKDLDIVCMISTDELTDEYGYLLMEKLRVEVSDIYISPNDDEHIYFDRFDVVDELREILCEKVSLEMTDTEFDELCEKEADKYFYKKAIVIWARN